MLTDNYANTVIEAIEKIRATQTAKISQAAELVKNTIENDGLIYVFGCGHSHMLAEETFYRAGGLACVAPVFYEPLMLHEGAAESSRLEKLDGLAEKVFEKCPITEKDLLICSSTSGVNAVPVEFARLAKEKGIPVVTLAVEPENRAKKLYEKLGFGYKRRIEIFNEEYELYAAEIVV